MWTYQGKEIKSHEDLIPECQSIVYELTFSDDTKYLGKLVVRSMRRIKPTKKQLAIRKNYKRVELKDIPFAKYEGSSKENEGKTLVSKEILYQCSNKRSATYIETSLLFHNDVLFTDKYNNKNIAGTHFDNALDGLLGQEEEEND